jgi:hypothetical protein
MPTTELYRFPMTTLIKYAIVLASGVGIGFYVSWPGSLERVANLARIDEIHIHITNSFVDPRPEAAAIVSDPTDPGRVNEDLDYLIAKRIGTLAGWQTFLAAHANGARAESAEAEIDKLSLLARASQPAAAEVSDLAPPGEKVEPEAARLASPSQAAFLRPHRTCNDGDGCLEESRNSPSDDEIADLATDRDFGKLRPRLVNLIDGFATATDEPNSAATAAPQPEAKPRATAVSAEPTVSSHITPNRRERSCGANFECRWKTRALPPIVLALFGVKPKHAPRGFGQTFAEARPSELRGR